MERVGRRSFIKGLGRLMGNSSRSATTSHRAYSTRLEARPRSRERSASITSTSALPISVASSKKLNKVMLLMGVYPSFVYQAKASPMVYRRITRPKCCIWDEKIFIQKKL